MSYNDTVINDPSSIPDVLYKYRDWENDHHKRILTEFELYFPSVDQFNDPFDGSIPIRYRKGDLTPSNVFQKLYKTAKENFPDLTEMEIHEKCFESQNIGYIIDENHMEKVYKEYQIKKIKKIGIFSLTNSCNNHLMWSHYSNSHKGFCIGFKIPELKNLIGKDWGIFSLYYEKELPYIELNEDYMVFTKKLLCTKSDVWEYELEYRIIRYDFTRKILKITPEAVSEVIFGVMMEYDTKMEILELIKSNFPETKVFEAKRNKDFFKLDIGLIYEL